MSVVSLTEFFEVYGVIVLFVIILLEYMNLPGLPGGVIMPLAGIWSYNGKIDFVTTIVISVLAGLCGSLILYIIGRISGDILLPKYYKKFPKQEIAIKRVIQKVEKRGNIFIFVTMLIPVVRTIISIPAGAMKMNVLQFTIYCSLGIFVWNFVFIGAGYVFGDKILYLFS